MSSSEDPELCNSFRNCRVHEDVGCPKRLTLARFSYGPILEAHSIRGEKDDDQTSDVRCPAQHGPGDRMRRQQHRNSAEPGDSGRTGARRANRRRRRSAAARGGSGCAGTGRSGAASTRASAIGSAKPAGRTATAPPSNAAPAPAPRPAEPPKPVYRDVSAAVGTALSLSLITPLSTETAKVETPVTARLRQPIVVDGFTVVPAGATLHGDVTEVERAGRVQGPFASGDSLHRSAGERSARSVPHQRAHLRG